MKSPFRAVVFSCLSLLFAPVLSGRAEQGFAGDVTGGEGGRTIVVRSGAEFEKAVGGSSDEKRIIHVDGHFKIGEVQVSSNRTIIGIGQNPSISGTLRISERRNNIIIRNITFTSPKRGQESNDGITIKGGRRVWIDHCTFYDCSDGCVDVTEWSDRVTVSWCKFYYVEQKKHRFTMLAMGPEKDQKRDGKKKKAKENKLRITLHHNWWSDKCGSRMPAARNAKVHMYNNYFSCKDNDYCSDARGGTEMLSQNNYYEGVKNPLYTEEGAKLRSEGNVFEQCTGKIMNRKDDVFKPEYSYTLDKTKDVPSLVRAGAGAH